MVPAQLQQLVADATGIPSTTVHVYARVLREGGHIATGGRGRSARQVTVADAACLCLALIGTTGASAAVGAIDLFKKMRVKETQSSALLLDFLAGMPKKASALDAMEALIDRLRVGEIQGQYAQTSDDETMLYRAIAVRFRLSGGRPALAFSLAGHGAFREEKVTFEQPDGESVNGLETVVKFSGEGLAQIAMGFREAPISSPETE